MHGVRGEAEEGSRRHGVSDLLVVRERFALDDRTFTVLAEPWYDGESGQWKGRLLYIPLDRSLGRAISTPAVKRSKRRDDLVRRLGSVTDREVTRAARALLPRIRRGGRRVR